jgi:glycosyltransferase involved in cell wall biosynthesis
LTASVDSDRLTVTAVIPTYRRPALLKRAIQSVLAQSHRDLCVRVYDNASGDATADVVRELAAADPRVDYFAHPANIGATRNFQFGMRDVRTPFFSCLSDDDVLFPDFYATALRALETAPDALMAIGSTLEFNADGKFLYAPLALWPRSGRFDPPDGAFAMLDNRHPTWTGIVFRTAVIEKVGIIDADVGGPADLDFELRVAARHPFVVTFAPCAAYLNHATSVSAGENASVIAGYRRMAANIEADDTMPDEFRARLVPRLHRQMSRKLIEITVKGLCGDRDDVASGAAAILEAEFAPTVENRIALTTFRICRSWRVARAMLRGVEALRLWLRARRSASGTRAKGGVDPADFAKYVRQSPAPPETP